MYIIEKKIQLVIHIKKRKMNKIAQNDLKIYTHII